MNTVAFILPDALFTSGVTGMLDLFYFTNRIAERDSGPVLRWILLSENGQAVRSASGILLAADGSWHDPFSADAIVLPGVSYSDLPRFEQRLHGEQALYLKLRQWQAEGKIIAANCTSVAYLAESGLLDQKKATISWWLSAWFARRYPKTLLQQHAILTEEDNLLCSGATSSYMSLGLRLIERFAGHDLAQQCSRMMLIDTHRASQAPYTTLQQYSGHNDPLIESCQLWLQQHIEQPFSLAELASAMNVGERTLMRRFQQVLGDTPLHHLQLMRLSKARRLLENSALAVEQIMLKVGYSDVSSFRRLFKRELSCSPGEYRRRFACNAG